MGLALPTGLHSRQTVPACIAMKASTAPMFMTWRADGSLSNRRLFLEKPDCDGMALDADGNVWITGFSSSHIERVAPDGTVLDRFETPAEAITQCRFGGADMRTLYMVTVPGDAGANLAAGRLPERRNSHLVRVRVDTPGQVIPKLPGS